MSKWGWPDTVTRRSGKEGLKNCRWLPLASEYPALLMEPLQDLTNFHSTTVPGSTAVVNVQRRASLARRSGLENANKALSPRPVHAPS